ncbi:Uncharacterised protein r2_g1450 [Pycnogonum litorale]
MYLISSVSTCETETIVNLILNAAKYYEDDIPSPELLSEELSLWRITWEAVDDKPSTAAKTLKICDQLLFPNIHQLLCLLCTLPVTSCECERSFSTLRRLNNYNRCTMASERLSSLALMSIHYDHKISKADVIKAYCSKNTRKMHFGAL